ncbi:MAG: hypothetical protein LKI18_04200 [Prevotella sp.]|jgi:hypothetical protein|nr:hypothetical protein [Prevotella sp.]
MYTICELYDQVLKSYKKYYDRSPSFNLDILNDFCKCKCFIKNCIKAGGKDNNYLNDSLDNLSSSRVKHIVSCFLLGFVFCENISIKDWIDKKLCVLCHDYSKNWKDEFSYIWMLICFFHDLGYNVEEGKNVALEEDGVFPPRWGAPVFLPRIYTRKAVSAYEKYREQECKVKVDHGIYGGKVCYRKLCEIRRRHDLSENPPYNLDNMGMMVTTTGHESLGKASLIWDKSLERVYACISWTIMCHNMFFVQEDREEAKYYKAHDLSKFVYKKRARKIRLKDSPFLFLLCLVDTLEPIKKFNTLEVLKLISLDVDKMKIKLDVESIRNMGNLDEWKKYRDSVNGLNDWLCDFQIDDGADGRER